MESDYVQARFLLANKQHFVKNNNSLYNIVDLTSNFSVLKKCNQKLECLILVKFFLCYCRERQVQLEELTKELKRVTEETDLLKHKLQSMKSSNQVP